MGILNITNACSALFLNIALGKNSARISMMIVAINVSKKR
jgi:hypothetical protein